MGCDLIRSQVTIVCPIGSSPGDDDGNSDTGLPQEAGTERFLCLECASESDGCKSCYDLGTNTRTTTWTAICYNAMGQRVYGQGTTVSTYQCYECATSDPLPEHCSPPPPPPPGSPASPGSPGSPTPPPPPPPTPGCVNGGFFGGGF